MAKLYFVTGNKNKFLEVKSIFDEELPWIELSMAPLAKLEIQSEDLVEIVKFAAENLFENGYCDFFVEDAGLFIKSLNGFPGPYSSYVFKTLGCDGVLKLMNGVDDREAYFKAVIALCLNGSIYLFEGRVEGYISSEVRGDKGFGFDPIFIPLGESRTFAEMDMGWKNKYSHRARAVRDMVSFLKKNLERGY